MNKFLSALMLSLLVFVGLALAAPGAIVYTSPSEYPFASGYEYQHSVQTADYAHHSSVSAPLNGFVGAPEVYTTHF